MTKVIRDVHFQLQKSRLGPASLFTEKSLTQKKTFVENTINLPVYYLGLF